MEENPLSSREKEILQLIAQGKSNKEIAADLVISVNTVKVHISNIFQKFGVASRSEAIVYALEHGLIEGPRQEAPEPQVITEFVEAEQPQWLIWLRKFWWLLLILLVVLIIVLSLLFSRSSFLAKPTPTPDPLQSFVTQDRWQILDPLKPARVGLAGMAYRNQIFAIGGESLEGISALNQSYSTRNNRWSQHAPKPTAVKNTQAIELAGKIYIFGGEIKNSLVTDILEVYDIQSDTWVSKAKAPIALSRYAATMYEGKIYYFGGWDGEKTVAKSLIYDPESDTWAYAADSPSSFADAFAVATNDRIMVIGGTESKDGVVQNINTLRVFTPPNGENTKVAWSDPLKAFEAKEILAVQNLGDSIVVFSALESGEKLLSYYAVHNETWMHAFENSKMSIPKQASSANMDGAVYFIGGLDQNEQASEYFAKFQAIFKIMLPAITN
jgi:DNA-binding CsgD family transcriptional regulator/N-acetylneuraminic acid mutarotase